MKSLIATLCTLGVVGMVIGAAVLGATEATITATVTVQNISLSVSDGSIAYGVLPTGYSKSTCDLNDTQTVTNDGNVAEDFNIKGKDSENWTLADTAGTNQYVHKFATSPCPVTWGGTGIDHFLSDNGNQHTSKWFCNLESPDYYPYCHQLLYTTGCFSYGSGSRSLILIRKV